MPPENLHHARSLRKKSKILGMPFGTACYKLRQIVLFNLLKRHGENFCFRCQREIADVDELSLEHKQAWQNNNAELFWDVTNIAFSHRRCNIRDGFMKREFVDGMLWCRSCKQFLTPEEFHKEKREPTGYAANCKECSNRKRRKVKATGDCNRCGARSGSKPFRATHNLCRSCHQVLCNQARQKGEAMINVFS